MGEQRPFPIVEYAHKIGKNTKDFTANDMVQFTRWWLKQATRKDILAMETQKTFLTKSNQTFKQFKEKYVGPVEEEAVVENQEQEVVCEIGLTQEDVDALTWGLNELITTYDFSEHEEVGTILENLLEALKGV